MDTNIMILNELAKNIIESDSESSDDENMEILLMLKKKLTRVPHIRCQNYINVVSSYTDEEFKMHFRMKRSTFQFLLQLLTPHLNKQSDRFGRQPITPERQLLIAIWMMATPNCYRCVSDRFDVGKATAWRSVHRVINALYKKVRMFIRWPTREEAEQNIEKIQQAYSFPNVIGAVDGTHIRISAPKDNSESYVNRKEFHSIQLQVICDARLQFIHCYTGQVGSVHDMRVFRLSNFESLCTEENFPHDSHILGDAAYRLTKYVMVPFKDNGHLSDRQINFNTRLSSARMTVERALDLLKSRFRSILDTLCMHRTELIPKYIMACCILHNICLLRGDMIDIPIIVHEPNIERQPQVLQDDAAQREGADKRNAIMYLLPNN